MGKTRPKDIGTAAETAVVRKLRELGWPHAERRALAGTHDLGDVVGMPGICVEVKGGEAAKSASDAQIQAWLDETECERLNSHADYGLLVQQRRGVGPGNADRWWAWLTVGHLSMLTASTMPHPELEHLPVRLTLADACAVLVAAGWGGDDPWQVPS